MECEVKLGDWGKVKIAKKSDFWYKYDMLVLILIFAILCYWLLDNLVDIPKLGVITLVLFGLGFFGYKDILESELFTEIFARNLSMYFSNVPIVLNLNAYLYLAVVAIPIVYLYVTLLSALPKFNEKKTGTNNHKKTTLSNFNFGFHFHSLFSNFTNETVWFGDDKQKYEMLRLKEKNNPISFLSEAIKNKMAEENVQINWKGILTHNILLLPMYFISLLDVLIKVVYLPVILRLFFKNIKFLRPLSLIFEPWFWMGFSILIILSNEFNLIIIESNFVDFLISPNWIYMVTLVKIMYYVNTVFVNLCSFQYEFTLINQDKLSLTYTWLLVKLIKIDLVSEKKKIDDKIIAYIVYAFIIGTIITLKVGFLWGLYLEPIFYGRYLFSIENFITVILLYIGLFFMIEVVIPYMAKIKITKYPENFRVLY